MKGRRLRDGFKTGGVRGKRAAARQAGPEAAVEPVRAAAPVMDVARPLRAATNASENGEDFGGVTTEADRVQRFAHWGRASDDELPSPALLKAIATQYFLCEIRNEHR
jgi:hypothetical protein